MNELFEFKETIAVDHLDPLDEGLDIAIRPIPGGNENFGLLFRAWVTNSQIGLCDASGPTEEIAREKCISRYWRKYLGVEQPGITTPDEALGVRAGQLAWNGCRFALWRRVAPSHRVALWIMLNPSTADHEKLDATMRRVINFSRAQGYGWVTVGNCFPWRATDPADLKKWWTNGDHQAVMAENDRRLRSMAQRADVIVAAWGTDGALGGRADQIQAMFPGKMSYLRMTKSGQPSHPVRLPKGLRFEPLR